MDSAPSATHRPMDTVYPTEGFYGRYGKVFYHSCGAVYDVIPDFIEIGVDILNPIQRSAAGMAGVDLAIATDATAIDGFTPPDGEEVPVAEGGNPAQITVTPFLLA